MAKVSDLTDQQLVEKISKYDRLFNGLLRERKRRIREGSPPGNLMTVGEKKLAQKIQNRASGAPQSHQDDQRDQDDQSSQDNQDGQTASEGYHLDLGILAQNAHNEEEDQEEEVEEVRVTQLIRLSKSKLEALQERGKKKT